MTRHFIAQACAMLRDQRREVADIERKLTELDERKADLRADLVDAIRGVMKSEQLLERFGVDVGEHAIRRRFERTGISADEYGELNEVGHGKDAIG